jgi:hypothetical protein
MDMKQPTGGDTLRPTAKITADGVATPHVVTAETRRRQRRKNWALLIVLVALCVLFYLITIVRMGNHG